MKKLFIIAAALATVSFAGKNYFASLSTAEVNQVQGYYIFTDSKPAGSYEYIATIKVGGAQLGKQVGGSGICLCEMTYSQFRDETIRLAKKKHKDQGNAIILSTDGNSGDLVTIK